MSDYSAGDRAAEINEIADQIVDEFLDKMEMYMDIFLNDF
jgi:hypothetical protein